MYTVYWQSLIIVFFQLPGKYKKSFHAENLLKNKKNKAWHWLSMHSWRRGVVVSGVRQ